MSSVVTIESRPGFDGEVHLLRAQLGKHIRTNPEHIAHHCFRDLGAISEDLATIIESIALADRIQTRHRAKSWNRSFRIEIPVYEKDLLSKSTAYEALIETVGFLTGDDWRISFVNRADRQPTNNYLPLSLNKPRFVVPYSNGLDSFAQSKLLRADYGNDAVLELRAGMLLNGIERSGRAPLRVPRRFSTTNTRELTYRTRPLVYFSLAAIAAATAQAPEVAIGESGQGALGPSFARFANEWPFRSAHPGFISRLEHFLALVLGTHIKFLQPQLWRTKGEVMRELKDRDLLEGGQHTDSCSVRPLQRLQRKACGFCGGCLLRQTALHAGGIAAEKDYAFNVHSTTLELTDKFGQTRLMSPNEKDIISRAAMSMALFANVLDKADADYIVSREARDISDQSIEVVHANLISLIKRHRAEWRGFLQSLSADAWLNVQFLVP